LPLIKTKKHAKSPEKSRKPKNFKIGLSLFAQSLGVDASLPVFSSVRRKEKPFLTINTQFTLKWIPPSSSESWKPSLHEHTRKAGKEQLGLFPPKTNSGGTASGSSTLPNSPTSTSAHTLVPRKSSLTSLFFMTPRQRKLQEIRLGKLPAVASDLDLSLTSKTSISSEETPMEIEIEDPSCSTTYNRRSRVGRSHTA